jgi:hypothetical protein
MAVATSYPRRECPSRRTAPAACRATASPTARAVGSGSGSGSPKNTRTASPVKAPTVAPCSPIRRPSISWNDSRTVSSSSGPALPATVARPRSSQVTTAISRRWGSSSVRSPDSNMASASCGDRKRRSTRSRSSSTSCSCTRSSRVWFHAVSSVVWRSIASWYRLSRLSDDTRASSSGCSSGWRRKSSAPASRARTRSSSGAAVTITTGSRRVRGSSRMRRQTS